MISPEFYNNSDNISQVYLGGNRRHFLHKNREIVVKSHSYTMTGKEDLYSVALDVFSPTAQYRWTIIGDINPLKQPDDWQPGDNVLIPDVIVFNSVPQIRSNSNVQQTTASF